MKPPLALGADAPEPAHRQRRQEIRDPLCRQDHQPVGFAVVARQFRQELVGRHAHRGDQVGLGSNALLDLTGHHVRWAE